MHAMMNVGRKIEGGVLKLSIHLSPSSSYYKHDLLAGKGKAVEDQPEEEEEEEEVCICISTQLAGNYY